jgi:hypothetical protein
VGSTLQLGTAPCDVQKLLHKGTPPSKRLTVLCCFCQDPWYNGPMHGYGRDEANSPGIALDTKRVQVYTCLFFLVGILGSFFGASVCW